MPLAAGDRVRTEDGEGTVVGFTVDSEGHGKVLVHMDKDKTLGAWAYYSDEVEVLVPA